MEEKKSTEVTGCRTCKQRLSGTQKTLIFIGVYMTLSSLYGTIHLINNIISFFK
jgi:hypothetical protein